MNSKTILAVSLAAIFAVTMLAVPAAASGHLTITDSTIYQTGGTLNAIITTSADIPVDGSADFGYAFPISDGSGRLLAAATHGNIGKDSSGQNKDINAMHTHIVTLQASGVCGSGTSIASATKNEVGSVTVSENFLVITRIPTGTVPGLTNSPVAFPLSTAGSEICVG